MLLKYLGPAVLGLSLLAWSCNNFDAIPVVYDSATTFDAAPKMVMIVSFDGLRSDATAPDNAEHIQSVASAGVSASGARTFLSSALFEQAKKRGLRTAMVVGKKKFKHYDPSGSVDTFVLDAGTPDSIASATIGVIHEQHPQLIFVHFAQPEPGSNSRDAIDEADQGLGQILHSLKTQNLLASTAVIVTADRVEQAGEIASATSIPWFAAGAGVGPHRTLASPDATYDLAATAAKLLSVPIRTDGDSKTVL